MAENTNTILNFAELQNVSLSDILYVIHGTGLDRDKYATLENVAKGLALNGYGIAFEKPTFVRDEDDGKYYYTIDVAEKGATLYVISIQTGDHDVYLELKNVNVGDAKAQNVVILNNGSTGSSYYRNNVYLKYGSGSYNSIGKMYGTWLHKIGTIGGVAYDRGYIPSGNDALTLASLAVTSVIKSQTINVADRVVLNSNGIETTESIHAQTNLKADEYLKVGVVDEVSIGADDATLYNVDLKNHTKIDSLAVTGTETHNGQETHNGAEVHNNVELHNNIMNIAGVAKVLHPIVHEVNTDSTDFSTRPICKMGSGGTPMFTSSEYNELGATRYVINTSNSSITIQLPTLAGDKNFSISAGAAICVLCVQKDDGTGFGKFAVVGG